MKIAIVGGKLQGLEAIYLAKKAGYETLLIDRSVGVAASGLCDWFVRHTFSSNSPPPHLGTFIPDVILPACEDTSTLTAIKLWAETLGVPYISDQEGYRLAHSKHRSNQLFSDLNLPLPTPWPACGFPVLIKPESASGSKDVQVIRDADELQTKFDGNISEMVLQEYLDGPSYSIEVIGRPGHYRTLQITRLEMDGVYDCKRVLAPSGLSLEQTNIFEKMAHDIASKIKLHGIMDVEAIYHQNRFKLLEIDVRLPSQTPMAILWSSGINMVELLADLFLGKENKPSPPLSRHVLVEHILVSGEKINVLGERIMSGYGPLRLVEGFHGADEAIISSCDEVGKWVATLIFTGKNSKELLRKQESCHNNLAIRRSWQEEHLR